MKELVDLNIYLIMLIIDRTSITFHLTNGKLAIPQDGSSTYSSAPTIRLTVDENGIDVNGSIEKILVHLEFHTHLLVYLQLVHFG